jgi:serine/threonine protein phosphatase PrpC
VDVSEHALLEGDMLVLCSDGLTRMVTDPEIASTITMVEPAQAAANRLIELANEYGGADNATVIVVRILQGSNGLLARLKRWTTGADDRSSGKGSGNSLFIPAVIPAATETRVLPASGYAGGKPTAPPRVRC